jgi:hypothetical protein
MNVERPELRLVREKLESLLAPELASSILFDALAEVGGAPPASGEATLALVEGPLARVLGRRVRKAEADVIVRELVDTLRVIVGPALTPVQPMTREKVRELEITLEIQIGRGAVGVLVLSSKPDLAMRLEAALGPGRISTRTLATGAMLESQLRAAELPPIVLVDAVEFAPVEPVELAAVLKRSRKGTIHAIWGADLAYGSMVLGELLARRVPATPLDRREGIEPFLDLVKSRRG